MATPHLRHGDRAAAVAQNIKPGWLAEGKDLIGAFVLLASDAMAMITGTAVVSDEGWTAG